MLSYRHGYHAGGFADLLKHAVLSLIIEYLKRKPAPIRYIDTHAGGGLYDIGGEMAAKTGEFAQGIGSLEFEDFPAQLQAYRRLIESYLSQERYPGSPLIAADLLRPQDELKLFELHSTEAPRLQALSARDRRVRVSPTNGFLGLLPLLPVQHARALVLVDPSYELGADYTDVVASLKAAYLRMSNGVFALWYPVIDGAPHLPMLDSIKAFVDSKLWQFELAVRDEFIRGKMSSTGMLVINPPWTLATDLNEAFRTITQQLPFDSVKLSAECVLD